MGILVAMPICCDCRLDLPTDDFYKNASRRGGIQARCKGCDKCRGSSPDRRAYQANFRETRAAALSATRRTAKYKERVSRWSRNYRQLNYVKQRRNVREARRLAASPEAKLAVQLRVRLCRAIEREWRSGSAVRLLGCTIPELRLHLESQFQPGMSWANWSRAGWHIDHIRPLVSFDLSDPSQCAAACHYTNLRPLWAVENMRKGAR